MSLRGDSLFVSRPRMLLPSFFLPQKFGALSPLPLAYALGGPGQGVIQRGFQNGGHPERGAGGGVIQRGDLRESSWGPL